MSSATDSSKYDAMVDAGWFQPNHILGADRAPFDGLMYETYGPEHEYVAAIARAQPGRVATILDVDGASYLVHGYHVVNRIGYFIALNELADFGEAVIDDGEPEEVMEARLLVAATDPKSCSAQYEKAVAALKKARVECGLDEEVTT